MNAVVENHPGRASAAQLLATAEKMQDQRIGVEFSPDHVVVMQENVLDLVERYAPHIHHICFADRKVVQEDLASFDGRYYYVRYESCAIGDGIVPGREMLAKLAHLGFDDYVSLEVGEVVQVRAPPAIERVRPQPLRRVHAPVRCLREITPTRG